MKKIWLAAPMVLLSWVALANPVDKYVTVTGAQYVLVENAPLKMQPAYQDSSKLIWGAVVKDASGLPLGIDQYDASTLCKSIQAGNRTARLPTKDELVRLRESMSASPNPNSSLELDSRGFTDNNSYNIKFPALPDLKGIETDWSSSTASDSKDAIIFADLDGEISTMVRNCSSCTVRCVLSP